MGTQTAALRQCTRTRCLTSCRPRGVEGGRVESKARNFGLVQPRGFQTYDHMAFGVDEVEYVDESQWVSETNMSNCGEIDGREMRVPCRTRRSMHKNHAVLREEVHHPFCQAKPGASWDHFLWRFCSLGGGRIMGVSREG